MKKITAPKELKAAGKKYWLQSQSEIPMTEAHDLERLLMACKCLDDLAEIEARVEKDGMFTVNRYGQTVEHPGIKMVRDTRLLFVKIIRELGLDLVQPDDSRPPRQY